MLPWKSQAKCHLVPLLLYIFEKKMPTQLMYRHLIPKLSGWLNSTAGKKETLFFFLFLGELSLYMLPPDIGLMSCVFCLHLAVCSFVDVVCVFSQGGHSSGQSQAASGRARPEGAVHLLGRCVGEGRTLLCSCQMVRTGKTRPLFYNTLLFKKNNWWSFNIVRSNFFGIDAFTPGLISV